MSIPRILLATAVAAASLTVAAPAAHACYGEPCDIACYVANSPIGQKLGMLCPA